AGQQPRGRAEIIDAVVEVATELFANRGPSAVSLRDVAGAAGVTLSQIYRHIGNKEALLGAVLAADVAVRAEPAPMTGDIDLADFLRALFRLDDPQIRTRLQARIILDG